MVQWSAGFEELRLSGLVWPAWPLVTIEELLRGRARTEVNPVALLLFAVRYLYLFGTFGALCLLLHVAGNLIATVPRTLNQGPIT